MTSRSIPRVRLAASPTLAALAFAVTASLSTTPAFAARGERRAMTAEQLAVTYLPTLWKRWGTDDRPGVPLRLSAPKSDARASSGGGSGDCWVTGTVQRWKPLPNPKKPGDTNTAQGSAASAEHALVLTAHDRGAVRKIKYHRKWDGTYSFVSERTLGPAGQWLRVTSGTIEAPGVRINATTDAGTRPWSWLELNRCRLESALRTTVRGESGTLRLIYSDLGLLRPDITEPVESDYAELVRSQLNRELREAAQRLLPHNLARRLAEEAAGIGWEADRQALERLFESGTTEGEPDGSVRQ